MARLNLKRFFPAPWFGPGRGAYRSGYRDRNCCRHRLRVPVARHNGDFICEVSILLVHPRGYE